MGYGAALVIRASNPKALTTWLSIATLFRVARADVALLAAVSALIGLFFHSTYATDFFHRPCGSVLFAGGLGDLSDLGRVFSDFGWGDNLAGDSLIYG